MKKSIVWDYNKRQFELFKEEMKKFKYDVRYGMHFYTMNNGKCCITFDNQPHELMFGKLRFQYAAMGLNGIIKAPYISAASNFMYNY